MEIPQQTCSDSDRSTDTPEASPFAAFARELSALVDQLELESKGRQPLGNSADQIHRLRERAERLSHFSD